MWEKKCAEIKTAQWKGGNLPIKSVETCKVLSKGRMCERGQGARQGPAS
jgi:hypothetical protein